YSSAASSHLNASDRSDNGFPLLVHTPARMVGVTVSSELNFGVDDRHAALAHAQQASPAVLRFVPHRHDDVIVVDLEDGVADLLELRHELVDRLSLARGRGDAIRDQGTELAQGEAHAATIVTF